MDIETLKALAELGYAFVLIGWLMSDNKSLKNRLRATQDEYNHHMQADIDHLRNESEKPPHSS